MAQFSKASLNIPNLHSAVTMHSLLAYVQALPWTHCKLALLRTWMCYVSELPVRQHWWECEGQKESMGSYFNNCLFRFQEETCRQVSNLH